MYGFEETHKPPLDIFVVTEMLQGYDIHAKESVIDIHMISQTARMMLFRRPSVSGYTNPRLEIISLRFRRADIGVATNPYSTRTTGKTFK